MNKMGVGTKVSEGEVKDMRTTTKLEIEILTAVVVLACAWTTTLFTTSMRGRTGVNITIRSQ